MVSSKPHEHDMTVLQLIYWHEALQEAILTELCSFGTKVSTSLLLRFM
jgi:hypothetical protein